MAKKDKDVAQAFPTRDWEAEDDFRTLQRADEVHADRDRHRRAIGHGKKQMKSMARIVSGGRRR